MPKKILIPLQSLVSGFLEPPSNGRAAVGATEGLWRGYSWVCPKGTTGWAPVVVTQAGGGSSVLTLCAKDQANENCERRSDIWQIFQQAMKGIPWHIFPTAFSSCPSALSPGTRARPKPRMPGSGSEVLLQKFSERQSDKWEVDLLGFREKHMLQGVGHC